MRNPNFRSSELSTTPLTALPAQRCRREETYYEKAQVDTEDISLDYVEVTAPCDCFTGVYCFAKCLILIFSLAK